MRNIIRKKAKQVVAATTTFFDKKLKPTAIKAMVILVMFVIKGKVKAQEKVQDKKTFKIEQKKEINAEFKKFKSENEISFEKKDDVQERMKRIQANKEKYRNSIIKTAQVDTQRLGYYNNLMPNILNFISNVESKSTGKAVTNARHTFNTAQGARHAEILASKEGQVSERHWQKNFSEKGVKVENINGADFVTYQGYAFGVLKDGRAYSLIDVNTPGKTASRTKYAQSIIDRNKNISKTSTPRSSNR